MKVFYLFINAILIGTRHNGITQVTFINILSCYWKNKMIFRYYLANNLFKSVRGS